MKDWNLLKQDILKYNNLSNNDDNWRFRYLRIKNNFDVISLKELKDIAKNDTDTRVKDEAKSKIELLEKYDIRKDFNNVVTVKLILPVGCNAKCEFCYNNDYKVIGQTPFSLYLLTLTVLSNQFF